MDKYDGDCDNTRGLKQRPGCRKLQKNSWQFDKFARQMKRPQGLAIFPCNLQKIYADCRNCSRHKKTGHVSRGTDHTDDERY
ncbi:hypothetical protein [Agrobacterium tumefaciens]|uniref:hypothetical protein n=1 Tax=Agrobacterium tumefaciens TaxID=358 RepID=UPI0013A6F33E